MSDTTSNAFHAVEIVVEDEVTMLEASRFDVVLTEPETEWRYDPLDVQADGVRLRCLRDAIEVVEGGS